MKTPSWVVKSVQPQENYKLLLSFASGEKKVYDALPLLKHPLYAPLNNYSFFLRAKADCGTVVWSDEIDIAPEHLYECSIPWAEPAKSVQTTPEPPEN